MTQPEDAHDIQTQFAQLQAEMKRAMAEVPASDAVTQAGGDEAADFQRIERGLEALRRDADRLRARMTPDEPATVEALAALRARTEDIAREAAEIGKRAEESSARLATAVQRNSQAVEQMTLRLAALAQRQPGRWLVPAAILLGAGLIAAAVMLDEPGRIERLVDQVSAIVSPPKPL